MTSLDLHVDCIKKGIVVDFIRCDNMSSKITAISSQQQNMNSKLFCCVGIILLCMRCAQNFYLNVLSFNEDKNKLLHVVPDSHKKFMIKEE